MIDGLAPPDLRDGGLASSLRRYAVMAGRAYGIPVTFSAAELPALGVRQEAALYRVAQEAPHNALRHSGAGTVRVRLARTPRRVTLEVGDDGHGFASEAPSGGVGLASMRERAANVGDALAIRTGPRRRCSPSGTNREPGKSGPARVRWHRFGLGGTMCLMQKFALCKEPAVVAGRSPAPIARAGPKGLHSRVGFCITLSELTNAEEGAPMSDEVLRLRGVEVRRDAAVLLRNVDWTAHENERWILIGPNGAGKTTLLQVAATTLFPSQGTVEVLGERLGEVDIFDLRPRIGLTSAAVAEQVPPDEKVIDLVLTASYAILGRWREDYDSADVTRAVELLDALGCAHLIRRKFTTLSEGERKRVQIARAMMPDPELLLLDEPAAGLDLGGREDLLRRLTTLARDPKAPMMVLVTHHVEEVPDGFTHAMLLRRGSVLAAGPVDEVFTARNLSRCFGVQLEIEHRQSRWTARAR